MNDHSLDADTAERMLRGEAAGTPELAQLLAAASSGLAVDDPRAEEAAVAAFRAATREPRPNPRRLSARLSLKAALIGLLLVLTGGVAVAATTQHLPGPLGHRHPDHGRTPATSQTIGTPPRVSSRPTPGKHGTQGTQGTHSKKSPKKSHRKKSAKKQKKKKNKKNKKNKAGSITATVPVPSASLPVETSPRLVVPGG